MRLFYPFAAKFSRAALLVCLCAPLFAARAQQQNQPRTPQPQTDEVIRISTDLVQTDVTVLDKQGRFVDNLRREQFELFVDGKPQPIAFFERIAAGSQSEETQLAAARGAATSEVVRPLDRGRTIFFYIDDMHMAPDSLVRARKTLLQFIDKEMGQNDQVAITSANGQVGFLQQLTDNKTVLRAAVARLKSTRQASDDYIQPPMSETMAQAIEVYNDTDVIKFYVIPLLMATKGDIIPPPTSMEFQTVERIVRNRARRILDQSYNLTRATLTSLENLARASGTLPGRKLIFFISDGFLLNPNSSDMTDRIRNITNASAKNGVVIYSLDGRGLVVGGFSEADNNFMGSNDPRGEMTPVVSRYVTKSLSATQEPLRIIAANTGGRALLNSNSLNKGFAKALQETSVYYLLAWRPESESQLKDKFRQIEVRVTGRPDLNVQVRRGYYDVAPKAVANIEKKTEKVSAKRGSAKEVAAHELREAISSPYPTSALPTQLGLIYLVTPDKGAVMTASIQIARQFMTYDHSEDKQSALIDLSGVVLNDQGKPVMSFGDRLNVAVYFPKYVGQPRRDLIYNFQSPLKPGLYQVRVAARDFKSGRTGSAMQWIEIPDIASRKLTLSSLIISETTKEAESRKASAKDIADSIMSVDRRFNRTSKLRFMTFIYNATRPASGTQSPDVSIQVQILRDDHPVVTTATRKAQPVEGNDPLRLAYAGEVPLETLIPGRYVLQITVIDRNSKTSAVERAGFEIE
ncbi:MAG TPA: VWA domain-containing protein [Pyrinomonadaceae bacterium]